MGSQKAAEDSLNKDNIKRTEFFVIQTQFDFSPGSRNKQVILDSYCIETFCLYHKSFIDQAC